MSYEKKITVAVVDDDASLCKALTRLLGAAGIRSTAYTSAEAFLNESSLPEPDCLLLDLQLSGMSGFELQRHLSSLGRTVPIIFITAYDGPEAREQALRAGGVGYFRKNDPG